MSGLNRPIKIVVDPAGNLAVCGRADVRRKKRKKSKSGGSSYSWW